MFVHYLQKQIHPIRDRIRRGYKRRQEIKVNISERIVAFVKLMVDVKVAKKAETANQKKTKALKKKVVEWNS